MNINGTKITVTEDDLTNALFNGATLEASGSFTKAEARQAARVMLAGPELLAALDRLLLCPALNEDQAEPETVEAWQQAFDAVRKAKGEGRE